MHAESFATNALFSTSVGVDWQMASQGNAGRKDQGARQSVARSHSPEDLFAPDEYEAVARFTAIQQRLVQLEHTLFEESGFRLDEGSKREFVRAISVNPGIRRPSVSADPTGKLTATWRHADGSELAMRFHESGIAHFSILTRPLYPEGAYEQRWGTSSDPVALFVRDPLVRRIAVQ